MAPYVVHADGNAQDAGQGDQVRADVAVADGAVVCAPGGHHRVDVLEGAGAGEAGDEPGGGPGLVGALVQLVVDRIGQGGCDAFGDLQDRAYALYQVEAAHGDGHAAFGEEVRGVAAAAEVAGEPVGLIHALRSF